MTVIRPPGDESINMKKLRSLPFFGFLTVVIITATFPADAQQSPSSPKPEQSSETARHVDTRDGQRDFDFQFGTWNTHIKRLRKPLTGSTDWVEYDGTSVVRKVWDGRASSLELEVDGPAGHIEGFGIRLYNNETGQWSLNWANGSNSVMTTPTIGEFKNGRGEFYDQELFNGRAILDRNTFSDITSNSSRFEQAFSDDGGKTWEINWIMTFTRKKDSEIQK